MNRIARISHVWAVFVLLTAALGPGLPVARADDGNPPPHHRRNAATTPPSRPADATLPAAPPGCANTTVSGSNNVAQVIPDVGIITSTITIAGAPTYLWAVSVTTNISHTYPNDLKIHLISPNGSTIILVNRPHANGPTYTNVFSGTTWSDQAGLTNGSDLPITQTVLPTGAVAPLLNPEEALSALRGENPNGQWKLEINDSINVDAGKLFSWSIKILALAQPPTLFSSDSYDSISVDDLPGGGSAYRYLYPYPNNAPVSAITVTTVITHPSPQDLNIYLVSPDGISVTLSMGNGGTHPNVFAGPGTVWTDLGALDLPPVPVAEYPFADNTVPPRLAPELALGELIGGSPNIIVGNNDWYLQVDNTGGSDGTLGEVILEVQTATCLPNLVVGRHTFPDIPIAGLPFRVTLTTANQGADATGVVMTATLPSLLTYQSINPYDWSCVTPAPGSAGGNVVCQRASQVAGDYRSVVVTATAPLLPQYVPLTVSVTSAQGDTYPPDGIDTSGVYVYGRSANHNPWDMNLYYGSIATGGQSAFYYWGKLRVAVLSGITTLADTTLCCYGLVYGPGHRWETTSPQTINTIKVSRSLFAPASSDWMRYIDTFTNTSGALSRTLIVDWGGDLNGTYNTTVAATSDGDQTIDHHDTWAVTSKPQVPGGPSKRPPVGYAFRSPGDLTYQGPFDFSATPITTTWAAPSNHLGHQFAFTLAPNATVKLAYFVYRGLSEATAGPQDCGYYGGCVTPAAGSQVALAEINAAALAANPYFCDLPPAERAQILNWPGIVQHCVFLPVVER